MYFNLGKLLRGEAEFMDWRPQDGMLLHVVPLDGSGKVSTSGAAALKDIVGWRGLQGQLGGGK